jgi:uncharacterized protein DUF5670
VDGGAEVTSGVCALEVETGPNVSRTTSTARTTGGQILVAQPLLKSHTLAPRVPARRRTPMLETIAIILIILWLLGMVSGYTLGNFIYVLLVIAIVLFLVRLISGRRV